MKFRELRERLIQEVGTANVSSNAYPGLGRSDDEGWILWEHDGKFEIGGEERGRWISTYQFETEEEACACLYRFLTEKPKLWVRTPEEEQRSREVNEAARQRRAAEQKYWRQHREHMPQEENSSSEVNEAALQAWTARQEYWRQHGEYPPQSG